MLIDGSEGQRHDIVHAEGADLAVQLEAQDGLRATKESSLEDPSVLEFQGVSRNRACH
jgi:hypothetical protein